MITRLCPLALLLFLVRAFPVFAAENADGGSDAASTNQFGHSLHGEAFDEGPRQKAYLMGGTGHIEFPVTSRVPEVQAFFNQGVGQLHGFWYFEAERSFRQVAALDTNCAMAYWGMALANLNNTKRARDFMTKALPLKAGASAREQRWIEAYAKFFQAEMPVIKKESKAAEKSEDKGETKARDTKASSDKKPSESDRRQSLIRALENISDEFPDDLEAKAFLAFQIWDNSSHGLPIGSQQAVDAIVEQVLDVEPMHPAHHYLIHLWDGERARRALASAARCGQTSPSVAHMWHMPGHIFTKLHRYGDAAWQQEASARVDHAYMMRNGVLPDQIHNYAHNNQWLVEDLEYVGRVHDAIDLAKNLIELPRHPKYNTLGKVPPPSDNTGETNTEAKASSVRPPGQQRNASAVYGRRRLFEVLTRFEMWDQLISLANTVYLEPTDLAAEQIKRLRALGLAYFSKGDAEKGREQIKALEKAWQQQREERQDAVEQAETAALQEKKNAEQVLKAMTEALQRFTDDLRKTEAALAELRGYAALASNDYAAALRLFGEAKDLPKERLSRLQLQAGDNEKAEKLAREASVEGTNRVHVLANYVDVLYRVGKKDEARAQFKKLRTLSTSIDLDVPLFDRLRHMAEEFDFPLDWRVKASPPTDVGQRPRLDQLGPFRWTPSPAPDWALTSNEGKHISLQDYRGKPVIVVFYLGHGCVHCIEQLNAFAPMADRFAQAGISLVAISTESLDGLLKSWAKSKDEEGFPFPLVSDPDLKTFKAYRAFDDFEQTPLHGTFLIDGQGRIRWQDINYEPFQHTEFLLGEAQRLLAQDAVVPLRAAKLAPRRTVTEREE